MPYPYVPAKDLYRSVRVTLPNATYDPEVGRQLYKTYFDIFAKADELGLDIMLNEHHATATCVEPAVPVTMAILARETKNARLLALGNPVGNRPDPVRVAEEMAMIDVISGGRAEVGMVRGVPYELSAGNINPVGQKERLWEAIDLIVKAWTTHDGPFSWEGEHFHHRQVNIWPRPYQQPHPPLWMPTLSASSAPEIARRQFVMATILTGTDVARTMFDAYRSAATSFGLGPTRPDRLAYLGLVFVGETEEEGLAGARQLQWYIQNNKVPIEFSDVPGYIDPKARAEIAKLRANGKPFLTHVDGVAFEPIEKLIERGMFFAGSPDSVYKQVLRFHDAVGGFSNFLMMMQGGTMGYELTARSMELYASEVQPRIREHLTRRSLEAGNGDGRVGAPTSEDDDVGSEPLLAPAFP
jgi:alkanesulfonate monooxygenase SsuD/methylene tetrahydromethanopterin reductase-like flavin-dependent oxidoreductase (luciferase family)